MNPISNLWYCIRFDFTRNYWLMMDRFSTIHGRIIMFHHVTDEHVEINDSCQCKIEEFRKTLLYYKNNGYEPVSLSEALRFIKNNEKRKFLVVTFDDIPDNVFTNAYPILKELCVPFTVFITVGFVDKKGYVTRKQLSELSKDNLCTIGAHTMTHPMLRFSTNYQWEISQSKMDLENVIGKPVKYFAYPYGQFSSVSKTIIQYTKLAGFDCALTTISSPLNRTSAKNFFLLPRFSPTPDFFAVKKYIFTSPRAIFSLLIWPLKILVKRIKQNKEKVN